MCVCVGGATHSLWDITQRNMKMASIFLKALKYYSSWPETISLSFLLDEDINTAFINLCTSEGANIHFVEIIRVWMPDHRGKHGTQLTPCSRRFCSPFFTLWLLLRVLINSGAHAARMHFPGGEENIQGGKKTERRKDNHQPIFPFLCNNPAEGVQIMAPDDLVSSVGDISLRTSSICIRSPICQSVYKAIKCSLIPLLPFGKG